MKRLLSVLSAALLLFSSLPGCGSVDRRAEKSTAPAYEAHFLTPGGETTLASEPGGLLTLPAAPEIENYVFRGWRNEAGEIELDESVTLAEESCFTAVYTVDFERDRHPAFLFADSSGRCRAQQSMTRGEAAQMLYALLAVKVEGTESFPDVDKSSPVYAAVCALKTLGVVQGNRYEPERELTLGELLQMLAAFFPPVGRGTVFADVSEDDPCYEACCLAAAHGWIEGGAKTFASPQRVLTRLEAAAFMNRVLERGESMGKYAETGYSLRDLPEDETARAILLEAMVDHELTGSGAEREWSSARLAGSLIEGFSSGDYELDKLLKQILDEQITDEMGRDEKLRVLYRYVRDHYLYRKGVKYEIGDVSWLLPAAKQMIVNGKGNCYCFAALLCELYRAIGIDAEPLSGTIARRPHAWVEADIDGVRYIFDVEMEYAYRRSKTKDNINMFMRTYEEMTRWNYVREKAADG